VVGQRLCICVHRPELNALQHDQAVGRGGTGLSKQKLTCKVFLDSLPKAMQGRVMLATQADFLLQHTPWPQLQC
jgi:hypothetical protein